MPITVVSSTTKPEAAEEKESSDVKDVQEEKKEESAADQKEVSAKKPEDSEALEDNDSTDESEDLQAKEGEDSEEQEEKKKPQAGFQKRIDKLTRQRAEARKEAEYWRRAALDKSGVKPTEDSVQDVKPRSAEGKPKQDDFETHEEWVEAVAEWKAETKLKEREEKSREAQVKTELQSKLSSFQQKCQALAKDLPDFVEAMEEVEDIVPSITVQDVLFSSENGAQIAYELAKDRKEFERINSLSPIRAAMELGRIDARIESSKESKETKTKPTTTRAPKPITPINGKSAESAPRSIFDKTLTQAQYEALRREQREKRAG